MKKYIKSTRGNLVYTIERQGHATTFRTPENYFKHETRAAWYSVDTSLSVFVYYKGIYYMVERTNEYGTFTTLAFTEISAEQAAQVEAEKTAEYMAEAETYASDTANAAIEYDAESAAEYASQAEFIATVAEACARRAAEYAAEAGTTEAASAADAAAEYAAFARSHADRATETAEQNAAEAAERAEIIASIEDPEERAHIEREAAAHQWTPDEARANVEHRAEARRRTEARKERYRVASGAAYDLLEAYEEATDEHVSEDSAEDIAAHHVAYADIAGAHYATARDYEIIDAMVEAVAAVATRPRPVSNPVYQRHELEAFLGEYVDDYDVDAIEAEATEHDPHTGRTVWTPEAVRDLWSICQRHELKA